MKKVLCQNTKWLRSLVVGFAAFLMAAGCSVSVSGEKAPTTQVKGVIQSEAASDGFSISGRKILDANGNEFIMRGISHAHVWYTSQLDNALVGMKATGANSVRIVLGGGVQWPKASVAEIAGIIEKCKANKLIAMLEIHDTTGYKEAGAACSLATAVEYWKEIKSALDGQEKYVMINIGNEPYGNSSTSGWQPDTQNAIIALRAAGFKHTLVVDAPNWGQDWSGVMKSTAAEVFNSDPDKNTILSVHMYEVYTTDSTILNYLNAFKTANLPLIVGEFGISNNGQYVDINDVMKECEALGVGYLAWSWCGNNQANISLDMVNNWNNASLTAWGDRVVNGINGIKTTAKECTVFGDVPVSSSSVQTSSSVSSKSSALSSSRSSVIASSKSSVSSKSSSTSSQVSSTEGDINGLKVQTYQSGSALQNQIYQRILLVNTSGSPISLSTVKIRYYMKNQGTASYGFSCDYSPIGSANVSGSFAAISPAQTGADDYNEITFSGSAGSIAANASVELQCRIWKNDWSGIDNSLNYSYNPATAYTDWNKVTVYQNGMLVWGTVPGGTASSSSTAVSSSSVVSSSSSTAVSSSSNSSKSSTSSSSSSSSSTGVVYTTITAPFTFDGVGTYHWKIAVVPSYINDWNLSGLVINGTSFLNLYVSPSQLPAKQDGYYYIDYTGPYSYSHIEIK